MKKRRNYIGATLYAIDIKKEDNESVKMNQWKKNMILLKRLHNKIMYSIFLNIQINLHFNKMDMLKLNIQNVILDCFFK